MSTELTRAMDRGPSDWQDNPQCTTIHRAKGAVDQRVREIAGPISTSSGRSARVELAIYPIGQARGPQRRWFAVAFLPGQYEGRGVRESIGERKSRMPLLGACLLVFVLSRGVAIADTSSTAEEINAEGKKLVKQLDLEGAAQRFRQAMELDDDPRYAFNLCYTLEKTRNFEEARLACKRVEGSGNSRLAAKATQLLVTIEKKIAEQAPALPPAAAPPPVNPTPQPVSPTPQPMAPALQPTGPAEQPIPPAYATGFSAPSPYLQQGYQPQQRTRSYRMHVLLTDAASFSFLLVGAGAESEGLTGLGAGGLILGGPLVHILQGNSRGAYLSLGARLLLPLGGALLFSNDCNSYDCFEEIAVGALLGFTGALVLDWFVIAKKTEWVNEPVQPLLSLTPDRTGAVAGLRFPL